MRDIVYYFDKLYPYQGHELGEIQTDFNMSFTIDGSKESTKLVVRSFSGVEIEPYTIICHYATNTWWCVTKDKVDRYANESGFVYVHTLTCNGAKELFNARDLIDCGFNDNRYTIGEFLDRLIKLSKWNFTSFYNNYYIVYGNNIDDSEMVGFIKTFENYTLLSAMREFLDGYNCDFKLRYTIRGDLTSNFYLENAYITIIPKTGNVDLDILDENIFGDVRESKLIEKNSYGTTVVSNAENVVSSVAKIYPSQGSVRLSASEYTITNENACVRLPSNVYKMNWLKMYYNVCLRIWDTYGNNQPVSTDIYVFVSNKSQIDSFEDTFESELRSWLSRSESWYEGVMSAFHSQLSSILEKIKQVGVVTFYEGNSLNPVDGSIVQGDNVPYIPIFTMTEGNKEVILTDKNTRNCLPLKKQGIYWTRGSDLIEGFDYLGKNSLNNSNVLIWDTEFSYTSTDYRGNTPVFFSTIQDNDTISLEVKGTQSVAVKDISFSANYIPMSDLKVEIDNQRSTKDMQLYNQNGRLTDSVALSKILNSYSREISSDKVTRFMDFYDFNDIPKAGQMVRYNNDLYVITNVSIDFFMNENDSYYMPCEFSLSKYTSTKSLMVNPNTNIRDYGIPQNYNVKRKQLYRDYLEFSYTQDNNADGTFYSDTIPLNLDWYCYTPISHTCVIRCYYSSEIGTPSSHTWYYQLETTIYRLEKMHIELLDFKDNNIIGYGSQNVHSAFQVSRIFSGMLDTINTPISYVDESGEVLDIEIRYLDNEQLGIVWQEYQDSTAYAGDTSYDLSNFSVFIPSDVFALAENRCDIDILEHDYKKDATEVPVFEYVFQVGDSDDVLVGDKILDNYFSEDDIQLDLQPIYFYGFVKAQAGTLNQINALKYANELLIGSGTQTASLSNGVQIDQNDISLTIHLWSVIWNSGGDNMYIAGYVAPESGYDYAIYRIKYSRKLTAELNGGIPELVMVLKDVPSSAITSGDIVLYKNKYKLK